MEDNNRTITVGHLLEYLDGRGLTIEDNHRLLDALYSYFELTFESSISYYHKED